MVELDHICLAAQNVYEATFRLSQETGFGNYDGGFFPLYGLGHKVVPLSPDVYIEVEGIVDYVQLYDANPVTKLYERVTLAGDCFLGLCFRASTMEEMECFAAHQGTTVDTKTLNVDTARQMMNGNRGLAIQVPSALKAWPEGMPNLYFKPDLSNHPASMPVEKGTGRSTPGGVEWIEIGADENQLSSWFGDVVKPADLNVEIRYNGLSPGLYAMGVKSDSGLIEIRRRPPTR
ncbi:VOC family protein [Caballeronia sp. LP003]|uniref:VOC family protein n=1 Tax=Caballeronia sp. LP003 TaxID=3038551 RepID=UPI002860602D|nr:VOC family protein [Caballeronia sp. LP003]MDR5785319.1 VOC family protein [Caballeronia sp. LP003]